MSDQAFKTPLVDLLRSVPKDHLTEWATQWSEDGAETGHAMCPIGRLAHEAADIITEQAVPNEQGKNRYGLDMAYFRNLINRELNRPLVDFKPDELARVFARASRTADPAVMHEPEFAQATPPVAAEPEGYLELAKYVSRLGWLVEHEYIDLDVDDELVSKADAILAAQEVEK